LYNFTKPDKSVNVTVRILLQDLSLRNDLPVVVTEAGYSGYMTSPGFHAGFRYPEPYTGVGNVTVPDGHSVMISFPDFNVFGSLTVTVFRHIRRDVGNGSEDQNVGIGSKDQAISENSEAFNFVTSFSESGSKFVPARVFTSASLVSVRLHSMRKGSRMVEIASFKMLFTFHLHSRIPEKLEDGLFNCSVNFYPAFRRHLDCNLLKECLDGQDETG
jgi:hypothetical protein